MTDHSGDLSPAQIERLAMLMEEAGEIIQAAGKVLRHGYAGHNPNDPRFSNGGALGNELSDLLAVVHMMMNAGDPIYNPTATDVRVSLLRKSRYSHHQGEAQ